MDNTQLVQVTEPVAVSGIAYWIRLTTYNQQALFNDQESAYLALNEMGDILANEWSRLAEISPDMQLDDWTVMPSSIQGIFILPVGAVQPPSRFSPPHQNHPPRQLSAFVASFKAASATRINLFRNQPGEIVWQRGYQQQCLKDQHILRQARQRLMSAA